MLHPETAHDLARSIDAHDRRPAPRRLTHDPRRPRATRLREALGYRLVVTGWRLLDGAVSGAAAPPARTGGPRPA
jgi:hypothetical protein